MTKNVIVIQKKTNCVLKGNESSPVFGTENNLT